MLDHTWKACEKVEPSRYDSLPTSLAAGVGLGSVWNTDEVI